MRIAVILPSLGLRDGEILRGLRAYAQPGRLWRLQVAGESADEVKALREWGADGVVGVVRRGPLADELMAWGVPLVNVSNGLSPVDLDVPRVATDDVEVGAMVARYFLDRGFRHFAMFEEPGFWWSECRRSGYESTLRASGHGCSFHSDPTPPGGRPPPLRARHQRIVAWTQSLPTPLALFVVNDYRARDLLEILGEAGIDVPTEVSVVGVENDSAACEVSVPPLSSVATDARRIGYEAAEVLDGLLAGRPPAERHLFLPPTGVITRQSSDLLATADPDVQAAARFIQANSHRRIGVEDVVRALPTSRRRLERRFAAILGRSVLREITRARVDRAKRLLVDTDLPMTAIAARSGFASPQRFDTNFRHVTGLTPTAYRGSFRLGGRPRS